MTRSEQAEREAIRLYNLFKARVFNSDNDFSKQIIKEAVLLCVLEKEATELKLPEHLYITGKKQAEERKMAQVKRYYDELKSQIRKL